jgi:GDP-L-fucose synthase
MSYKKKVFIAGHNGMVGSAILRKLKNKKNIKILVAKKQQLNLLNFKKVLNFFKKNKIDEIYLCAAKVGGILENKNKQADFIYENSLIALNIIHAAFQCRIKKLLNFGSSCIFPKSKKKLFENDLLTGKLEPTNEGYAIAKILAIKLCEKYNLQYGKVYGLDYRSVMPCNLFGPNDNYDLNSSHVIPALIRKFIEARIYDKDKVTIWGTGSPKREFLHVDDLAEASIKIMGLNKNKYLKLIKGSESFINVGYGKDYTIKEVAFLIAKATGFNKIIFFDRKYPVGSPRKIMDISKIKKIDWKPKFDFETTLTELTKNILIKSIINKKFTANKI